MAKLYNEAVRDTIGALRYEGVGPKEIERRLHNDEAGMGFPVQIKERRIYEYIKDYEELHGPPPDPEDEDQTPDSIAKLKHRLAALIRREIAHFEGKKPGTLTHANSVVLRQHYATLDDMERRAEKALKRAVRSKPSRANPTTKGTPERQETPVERLAREARESQLASRSGPNQAPTSGRETAEGSSQEEKESAAAADLRPVQPPTIPLSQEREGEGQAVRP